MNLWRKAFPPAQSRVHLFLEPVFALPQQWRPARSWPEKTAEADNVGESECSRGPLPRRYL